MKINTAALALLATTAAAMPFSSFKSPFSVVNAYNSQAPNATQATAAPSETTAVAEPCVMPWGCRDEDKDDKFIFPRPPTRAPQVSSTTTESLILPTEATTFDNTLSLPPRTRAPPVSSTTTESSTVSVPTETNSVGKHFSDIFSDIFSILPEPTLSTSSRKTT